MALEQLVDPALGNFIYAPKVLQDIMSIDHRTDALESWQTEYECNVDEVEFADVVAFVFHMHAKTALTARTRRTDTPNPLHAIMRIT